MSKPRKAVYLLPLTQKAHHTVTVRFKNLSRYIIHYTPDTYTVYNLHGDSIIKLLTYYKIT